MNISPAIQKTISRSLLQVSKYSPQILTAVGIAGVVTAGVLAARATLKLEAVVEDSANDLKWTKQAVENGDAPPSAVSMAYVRNVGSLVKLYGPSVTLGVASLVCIVSAHGILQRRNVALVAAYKGLETAFGNYRDRVVETYGEEVDKNFRHGLRQEEITDEKGKKKKVLVPVDGEDTAHEYGFKFDMTNQNWSGFHEQNLYFVTAHQNMANDRLKARGHIFLNEILDGLGFMHTKAGAVVGWVYDENNPDGDNFIDFGIRNYQEDYGYILLNFNVDGIILDKI